MDGETLIKVIAKVLAGLAFIVALKGLLLLAIVIALVALFAHLFGPAILGRFDSTGASIKP